MFVRIIIISVIVFPLFFCCKSRERKGDSLQNKPSEVHQAKENAVPHEEDVAGGYSVIDISSQTSMEAFEYLKNELSISHSEITEITVQEAMLQVVAGYNIILICEYKIGSENQSHILSAKIYKDLQDNMRIKELELETTGSGMRLMKNIRE